MSDNRNEQLIRIFRIVDFLANSRFGKSIQEIHSHLIDHGCQVTDRTIRRDIKALESVLVPMTEVKDENGSSRYHIEPNSIFSQQFVMTPKALLGLYLTKGLASNYKASPFSADLDEMFLTVEGCLNERARAFFRELSKVAQVSDKTQSGHLVDDAIFATIRAACTEEQALEAEYESIQAGLKTRRLGPHAIYLERGGAYLLAEDLDSGIIKTFALPRFKQARMLDEPYRIPKLDPKEFFQNSFGVYKGGKSEEVTLEFQKEIGAYASETIWHPSQKSILLSSGHTRMTLSIALTPDFVNWVVGFGDKVTVQSPDLLKEKIYEIASALQKRYAPPKAV